MIPAAGTTGPLDVGEDFASIRNRQTIGKLVMCGRMGEAIALTNRLYPLFLQKNPSLHFMLKVRQFIEMVAGEQSGGQPILLGFFLPSAGRYCWNNNLLL